VLLDAGDAFASGFERAEKINKALVRAMNHLRYDAMGLGGFDLAMGEVALRELAAMAKFPMLCSNLEFQQGVAPWIKPYVILERNGRRVAVLSVLPASYGAVVTGARFVDPEKVLKTLVPKLRSMVDFVVLLTQFGSDEAVGLLGENTMVDVILGDRSAVSRNSPAYVPAVPKGLGLGLVRLNMAASGAPARVKAKPVLLGTDSDSQILKILDEIK
jgi:2',3'-cyclic-nucleotide 2'-phosphodiesterase (5'-nucleotidase family)